MDELKELQKKYNALEKKLTIAEEVIKDPSRRGYYALHKILYQQIKYLENFDFETEIKADPKADKIYDRAKGVWEGMKTMIMDCRALKSELNIPKDEEEKKMKSIYGRTTPESIADAIGNVAGQNQ